MRWSILSATFCFGGAATEECLALYRNAFAAAWRLSLPVAGLDTWAAAASRALVIFDWFFMFVRWTVSEYDMVCCEEGSLTVIRACRGRVKLHTIVLAIFEVD